MPLIDGHLMVYATAPFLEDRVERLQRENRLLRELRRLDLLEKYGPAAETLSDSQLELLELEPWGQPG